MNIAIFRHEKPRPVQLHDPSGLDLVQQRMSRKNRDTTYFTSNVEEEDIVIVWFNIVNGRSKIELRIC